VTEPGRQPEMPDATERYLAAAHAMQSGVAAEMQHDPACTAPKHLRVGVNSSLVNSSALAELLIAKGIITDAEYVEALAKGMECEQARYEQMLSARLGTKVTLG
jgi:hypothetical protein